MNFNGPRTDRKLTNSKQLLFGSAGADSAGCSGSILFANVKPPFQGALPSFKLFHSRSSFVPIFYESCTY